MKEHRKISKLKMITATTAKYGGIHDCRQYAKAVAMVDQCSASYDRARMYHLCLTGASNRKHYTAAMKLICRHMAQTGLDYSYKAAIEYSGKKGLHMHVFLITDHPRSGVSNPCSFLNNDKNGKLASILQEIGDYGLSHWIATPDNGDGERFLQLNNLERITDAKDWMSYAHKVDTKLDSGQTYYSSRNVAIMTTK